MPLEIPFPNFSPGFSIGSLDIRWYGVMYLIGFLLAWLLGRARASRPGSGWTADEVTDLIVYASIGVIIGGRVGYVLFYGFGYFLSDPLYLFRITEGGMSFHGGFLGVLGAVWLYGHNRQRKFWDLTDFIAPLVPLGLFFGRIGNFINGELWGAPTNLPWGMVFPNAGPEPRHPSMLYEALLEGLLLFAILWFYSARRPPRMGVSGMFLIGYGIFRSLVELVREPDAHLGYLAFDWLTMGMLLSLPMVLFGVLLMVLAYRDPKWPDPRDSLISDDAAPATAPPSASEEPAPETGPRSGADYSPDVTA